MLEVFYKIDHVVWSNFGYLVPAAVSFVLYLLLGQIPDRRIRWALQSACLLTCILMVAIFCASSLYHSMRNHLGPMDPFTRECNMYDHLLAKPGFAYLVVCIATAAFFLRSWRLLVTYLAACCASAFLLAIDWYELADEDGRKVAHSFWHLMTAWLPAESICFFVYAVLRKYDVIVVPRPARTIAGKLVRRLFINRILRI